MNCLLRTRANQPTMQYDAIIIILILCCLLNICGHTDSKLASMCFIFHNSINTQHHIYDKTIPLTFYMWRTLMTATWRGGEDWREGESGWGARQTRTAKDWGLYDVSYSLRYLLSCIHWHILYSLTYLSFIEISFIHADIFHSCRYLSFTQISFIHWNIFHSLRYLSFLNIWREVVPTIWEKYKFFWV